MKPIRNREEMPKQVFYTAIQNRKAMDYTHTTSFVEIDVVIAFSTRDQADYFVAHWENGMHNFKEACLPGHYPFWVVRPNFNGELFADEMHMIVREK